MHAASYHFAYRPGRPRDRLGLDLLYTGRGLPIDRAIELLATTAERSLRVTRPKRRRETIG